MVWWGFIGLGRCSCHCRGPAFTGGFISIRRYYHPWCQHGHHGRTRGDLLSDIWAHDFEKAPIAFFAAFAVGFFSVLLGGIIVGLALMFTEKNFFEVAALVVMAHIPVMIIEGFVTVFLCVFSEKGSAITSSWFIPLKKSMET
jgi:hypothetical protein